MTNMRIGPGKRYSIQWVYKVRNFPVKVLASFETWYKVRDIDKDEGWIHKRLLSKKRYALIMSTETLGFKNHRPVVFFDKLVIVSLIECLQNKCLVHTNKHYVWVEKKYLWGVQRNEVGKIKPCSKN